MRRNQRPRCAAYATCAGAVLLGLIAAPGLSRVHWSELPAGLWLNVAYLAVGATAVANLFYYRGVGAVGPASASMMMLLVPVINTVCGTLILGESFGVLQALGAAVLLSGAALAAFDAVYATPPAPECPPRRPQPTAADMPRRQVVLRSVHSSPPFRGRREDRRMPLLSSVGALSPRRFQGGSASAERANPRVRVRDCQWWTASWRCATGVRRPSAHQAGVRCTYRRATPSPG